ncbi:MAG TPA: two-component regulator propeller domain-containing protein [Bacteroidales bacterium]|nr:two-component regulator propeller domain-containing protein [Bacteroidales bacterium]
MNKIFNISGLIVLLSLLLGVKSAFALSASDNLNVELFTINNGLSQTRVNALLLDSKGFLWVGTQDGLNRFDGYNFKVFRHQPLDSSSISNNFINSITEDSKGNIWIATNNGLNRYNSSSGDFTRYLNSQNDPASIINNQVYYVYADSKGYIWVKTLETLERFNPSNGKFTHFKHFNDALNFISGSNYFSILEDNQGFIWVGTKDGLNRFNPVTETFKRYAHQEGNTISLSNNKVKSVFQDKSGVLWIGTDDGLNRFNRSTESFTRFYINSKDGKLNDAINVITQDKENFLWVGTNDGFYEFNKDKLKFKKYTELPFKNNLLTPTYVSSIIRDHSDIFWIGCLQGLLKIDLKGQKFKLYRRNSLGKPDFSSNIIGALFTENDKKIWIGTWGNGLDIYNRESGQVLHYNSENKNPDRRISDNTIHVIFRDSRNIIWVGTNSGVNVYDRKNGRFSLFCNVYPEIACGIFRDNRVFSVAEDTDHNLWFGTSHGLHLFRRKQKNLISYYQLKHNDSTLQLGPVYSVIQGVNGFLWLGTNKGLIKMNPGTGSYQVFRKPQRFDKNGLSSNSVYYLLQDHKDRLWAGTAAGLNKMVNDTGAFKVYTESNGLPNNLIYNIFEDNSGKLWMSTNRGISCFSPEIEKFTNYDLEDGLQSYEYNLGAGFLSKSGEMFFGGINGFNSFFPDSLSKNNFVPPVVITRIQITDEKGERELIGSDLKKIILPYTTKLLTIDFAALDFTYPEKNNYAYMLSSKDLQSGWIDLSNRHYASFSNLPPGEYLFRVKGSNNDNVWNNTGTSISIVVEAPLWKTRKAYFIYVLLILGFLFLFYQYRTRSLRSANRILREKELVSLEVARQKELLAIKNKNITDSINYARRIQEAMMPSKKLFAKLLPESFILHKPKDIVSGDFYWINENNHGKIFVAAVDCTGHGVPGAFMSIIGFELFRKITYNEGIEDPGAILQALNEDFGEIFKDEDTTLRDGMDIAFCVFDTQKNTLEFAGAFNPLYIIRENKIIEVKGDRSSVGLNNAEEPDQQFTTHTFDLHPDDMIYIFTDGYADQFGGPEGKKYKYRRFRHLLLTIHEYTMAEQLEILNDSYESWKGALDQVDDILVIGIKPGFK